MLEQKDDPVKVFDSLELYEGWDRDYYHPVALALYDRAIGRMLQELAPPADATVLDAGCGPGVHSIRVAAAGHRIHAIDVSQTALEEAQRRAESAGVASSITFQQQDLTRLDLPDGEYATVFCWGVVIHIPDIERALDELMRVVAPGGRLALQVTNARAFDHKLEAFARALLRRPNRALQKLAFGEGCWYETAGERLWVWQVDCDALVSHLKKGGLILRQRIPVEFTHIQLRTRGVVRTALLYLNNLWFRLGLPPGPAATNLLIFERVAPANPDGSDPG